MFSLLDNMCHLGGHFSSKMCKSFCVCVFGFFFWCNRDKNVTESLFRLPGNSFENVIFFWDLTWFHMKWDVDFKVKVKVRRNFKAQKLVGQSL